MLGENLYRHLVGELAKWGHHLACGADVTADVEAIASYLAGQLGGAAADFGYLWIEARCLKPRPRASKRGGQDELRAGLNVGLVQFLDFLGLLQHPRLSGQPCG